MKRIAILLLTMIGLVSCSKISEMEDRISLLEQDITTIKAAVDQLKTAYNNGKIIKLVDPINNADGKTGWKIVFSDDSSINVFNGANGTNGQNGITPYLLVDQDGYWCVSYDNGETFTRIKDNNGEYIKAQGPQGEQGLQGPQGAEGISVRIVVNDLGYYVVEMYYQSKPNEVIESIVTNYTADTSKIINSITQDDKTNVITISLADGTSYTFNKCYNTPSSIVTLQTKNVVLSKGTTEVIEFRVNPSNAIFNYDVNSLNCEIELDMVGKTRNSYVTSPENYNLIKVEQSVDENGVIKQGQYKAYIADSDLSTNYNEQVALVLNVNDSNNQPIQVSSTVFNVVYAGNTLSYFAFLAENNTSVALDVEMSIDGYNLAITTPLISNTKNLVATFVTNGEKVLVDGVEQISGETQNDFSKPVTYSIVSADGTVAKYVVDLRTTGLSIVIVNTPNQVALPPKTADWLGDVELTIINKNGEIDYNNIVNMRGRGNTTWSYPKKPYAIKLDKKASILGMPKHKRWVLLANWMDRTMLRNRVAFRISELTDLAWTPRGEFVELVLNGKHVGNYYLCEQIKIDENRVNIAEIEDTDNEGDAVTGGYLMELDVYYDEMFKFKSSVRNLPYMFKDPDEITDAQFQYMQNYVNTLEEVLYDDERFAAREYEDYLDVDSFIDWWFVHELTGNTEPQHPKSTYMYKDRLGKMHAGPVWDFDWATFVPSKTSSYGATSATYYQRLFTDPIFKARVKERWTILKPNFETVPAYIDAEADKLRVSDEINSVMWPIDKTTNGDETMTYQAAIDRMKASYTAKLNWLDAKIQQY